MNMPISHAEQQTLLEKRQRLYALWTHAAPAPEAAMGGGHATGPCASGTACSHDGGGPPATDPTDAAPDQRPKR